MGIWANRIIDRNTYLGWMSTPQGWDYFTNTVLPDVVSNGARVQTEPGSDLGAYAPLPNLVMDLQAVGAEFGRNVPTATLDQAASPPPPPAPTVDIPKPAVDQYASAKDIVREELHSWGLDSLTDFAWNLVATGASADEIHLRIRQQDAWKNRFKGIVQREKEGKAPVSEAQAIAYEESMRQMLHQYGIPPGLYNTDHLESWLGQDLSVAEQSSRASVASELAYSDPPETRAALERMYGIHEGDLTAWALEGQDALPAVQRKLNAAKIAGSASSANFGTLTAAQAEQIAGFASPDQAAPTFSKLAQQKALYVSLQGEGGNFTIDDLIGAYFGGDAEKLNALRQRAERRQAEFSGSGGVAQNQQGAYGAGVARPA